MAACLLIPHKAGAVAGVDLGTAEDFAFLAGSGITIAGAVNTTIVSGNIGTFPTISITGLANLSLSGVNEAGNAVTQTAKADLQTAYNSAVGRAANVNYGPGHDLGGQTLVSGVYNSSSTLAITGTVTLDAKGNPNAVWIFQAGSSLVTASNASVVLKGGAQACNVFWIVGSSATLGTGTAFQGNILALTSVTLTTGATVHGRVLALNGAVSLDTNTLNMPVCAVVVVVVPGTTPGQVLREGPNGIIVVAPKSYTLMAQTPNQVQVARALDRWIRIETGDIGAVTLALDLLTAKQYPSAFESLMPSAYATAMTTEVELSQNEGQLLFQQLSARHLGQRRPVPNEPVMPPSAKSAKNVIGDGKMGSSVADSGEEERRWTSWVQATGMFSAGGLSLDGDRNFESGTYLVGLDYALDEHVAVGLFTGYQEGWSDFDHGGGLDMKSVRFGVYATADWDGFYASAAVGGGATDYSLNREIQWATLDRSTRSSPHGNDFFALLGTGYDFHAGKFTFGPSASAQYTNTQLDSFVEHGAGVLDLRVSDASAESLRTYLGGRVAYQVKLSDHVTLIPELRLFWQHEFMDGGTPINAAFDGGRGPAFRYQSAGTHARDALYGGIGAGLHWGPRFTTSLYYNASFGRKEADQQSVTLVVEWRF